MSNKITWHKLKTELNHQWVDKKIICDPPDVFYLTFIESRRWWGPTSDELELFQATLTGDQVLKIEAMRDKMILEKLQVARTLNAEASEGVSEVGGAR